VGLHAAEAWMGTKGYWQTPQICLNPAQLSLFLSGTTPRVPLGLLLCSSFSGGIQLKIVGLGGKVAPF